jgi:hypothetical protein
VAHKILIVEGGQLGGDPICLIGTAVTAIARAPRARRDDREGFYYREGFLHLFDKNPSPG